MPQITLLKKTFQAQGNGIYKLVSDDHDRDHDQDVPAGDRDQEIPDLAERIGVRKRGS